MNWGVQGTQFIGPPFGTVPVIATVTGNPEMQSEIMMAHELGYRVQPSDRIALDLTGFYNIYSDLRSFEEGTPFLAMDPVPHIVQPITLANKSRGETYGAELSAKWEVTRNWHLDLGYSRLKLTTAKDATSTDIWNKIYETDSPSRQVQLQSSLTLPKNLDFEAALYSMGRINGNVDPYTRIDFRLAYRPNKDRELSIGVNNAFTPHHLEYCPFALECATEVQRNWYGTLTWKL